MINHIRTLLLNKTDQAAGLASGQVGSELVPTDFRPVELPSGLKRVRECFLPVGGTVYQENCMLMQLMQLLHTPELAPYTETFDARVTYDLTDNVLLTFRKQALTVQTWQSADCDVQFRYQYYAQSPCNAAGSVMAWTVKHVQGAGDVFTLQFMDRAPQVQHLLVSGARSQTIALIDKHLTFYLGVPSEHLTGAFRYELTYYVPALLALSGLLVAFETLSVSHAASKLVFDTWSPYETELNGLRMLWYHSIEANVRVGAYLLGYAFQCERLRRGLTIAATESTLRRVT